MPTTYRRLYRLKWPQVRPHKILSLKDRSSSRATCQECEDNTYCTRVKQKSQHPVTPPQVDWLWMPRSTREQQLADHHLTCWKRKTFAVDHPESNSEYMILSNIENLEAIRDRQAVTAHTCTTSIKTSMPGRKEHKMDQAVGRTRWTASWPLIHASLTASETLVLACTAVW